MIPWYKKAIRIGKLEFTHKLEAKATLFRLMNRFGAATTTNFAPSIVMLKNYRFRIDIPDGNIYESEQWGTVEGIVVERDSGSTIHLNVYFPISNIVIGLISTLVALSFHPIAAIVCTFLFLFLFMKMKKETPEKIDRVARMVKNAIKD